MITVKETRTRGREDIYCLHVAASDTTPNPPTHWRNRSFFFLGGLVPISFYSSFMSSVPDFTILWFQSWCANSWLGLVWVFKQKLLDQSKAWTQVYSRSPSACLKSIHLRKEEKSKLPELLTSSQAIEWAQHRVTSTNSDISAKHHFLGF